MSIQEGEHIMNKTRRTFVSGLLGAIGGASVILATPSAVRGCLVGKWKVRCPNKHCDIVDDVTCNHTCDTCHVKAFSDGVGDVVCPDGHVNHVSTGSRS